MSKSVQENGSRCLRSLLDYSNERARMGRGQKKFLSDWFCLIKFFKKNDRIIW